MDKNLTSRDQEIDTIKLSFDAAVKGEAPKLAWYYVTPERRHPITSIALTTTNHQQPLITTPS